MNSYSIRQNEQSGQYEFHNGRLQATAPTASLPHALAHTIAAQSPHLAKQAWRGADIIADGGLEWSDPYWCGDHQTHRCLATVASSSGNGSRYRVGTTYHKGECRSLWCDCKGHLHGSAPRKGGTGPDADTPMCIHLMALTIARRLEAAPLMTATSLHQDTTGRNLAAERAIIAAGLTPIRPLTSEQKTAVSQRKAEWRQSWDATVARQEAARRQPDPIGPALARVRRTDGRIIGRQQWEAAKVVAVVTDPQTAAELLGL